MDQELLKFAIYKFYVTGVIFYIIKKAIVLGGGGSLGFY